MSVDKLRAWVRQYEHWTLNELPKDGPVDMLENMENMFIFLLGITSSLADVLEKGKKLHPHVFMETEAVKKVDGFGADGPTTHTHSIVDMVELTNMLKAVHAAHCKIMELI